MSVDQAWNLVPLEDYEKHMQHPTVAQLQLLSDLTAQYLKQLLPVRALFIGIAGGNGLEHIDCSITQEVVGVDINANYLEITRQRFKDKIPGLRLEQIDVSLLANQFIIAADFVWIALVFEYVDIPACFDFIQKNITPNGYLVVTIQENNGIQSVSKTGVESIQVLGPVFRPVVVNELIQEAQKKGFIQMSQEKNYLPNGKSFQTILFYYNHQ